MSDGEIAPHGGRRGCSVVIYCEPKGGVLCMVNVDGAHRRVAHGDPALLLGAFLREVLEEFGRKEPSRYLVGGLSPLPSPSVATTGS